MGIPEGLNPYEYDPDTARALLEEMGWDANQAIVSLTVTPGEWWGEIVAQQINDVGIKFEIQQVEVSQLIDAILAEDADFDSFLNGGDTYRADPNISSLFYSTSQIAPAGGNFCRYSNPELDQFYVEGRATNDLEVRKEIYTKAAQILNDEVPAIFLWSPNAFFAVNNRVQGFMGPGYTDNRLWNAEDWTVTGVTGGMAGWDGMGYPTPMSQSGYGRAGKQRWKEDLGRQPSRFRARSHLFA